MLSVIIPSWKDPLLHKTIDSLLDNSEGEIEIIVVLDSYWPITPIKNDPRIKIIHLGRNRGMRGAINAGMAIAKGEFVMRLDEHCAFGKGYDRIMTESCGPNQIMTARRYFLNPVTWTIMDIPHIDYEKLSIQKDAQGNAVKFAGQRWRSRDEQRKDIMVDETTAMQGSMWIMPRKWFNEVCGGELQTVGYGPTYQDSVEVTMKTWQAGGKLMVNKNTWYAHKHRSFSRTHQEGTPENPSNREASWKYSLDTWRDYYESVIRPRFNI